MDAACPSPRWEAVAFALVMIFYAPRLGRKMEPRLRRCRRWRLLGHRLGLVSGTFLTAGQIGMAAHHRAFPLPVWHSPITSARSLRPPRLCHHTFWRHFSFQHGARLNLGVFDRKLISISAVNISLVAVIAQTCCVRLAGGWPGLEDGAKGRHRHGSRAARLA